MTKNMMLQNGKGNEVIEDSDSASAEMHNVTNARMFAIYALFLGQKMV